MVDEINRKTQAAREQAVLGNYTEAINLFTSVLGSIETDIILKGPTGKDRSVHERWLAAK